MAINPTGSTGFGQGTWFTLYIVQAPPHCCIAFTDAISEDWGGKPFVGRCFCYLAKLRAYTQRWSYRSPEGLGIRPRELP